jgi:glycosyltransferase involved in cell wall biosynthesis
MMNLWIFQHYATPPDTVSGTRHFNMAKMLSDYGYETTIFAAGFNHSTLKEERITGKELYRIEYIQGVRFVWIKTPKYSGNGLRRMVNMIVYAIGAFLVSFSLKQQPVIILASNPHLFSGITGYFLSKIFNAHFVFEVRDLWPQVFVDIGVFSPKHPLIFFLRMIEKFIYNRAEKIIVLMSKASEYIEGCHVDPQKIIYLPHALDITAFETVGINLPSALHAINDMKKKGKFVVGYLGAHGIADSLDTLLDCCTELKKRGRHDIQFVMIGHGSEKKRLEERSIELDLTNVSFFQAIPKNIVPTAIRLFDLAVVIKKDSPLYKYGTSFIKTFDYMACSVPILWAVNSQDCPVTEAGCGLAVHAEQPQLLADAVISFAGMSQIMRQEIGCNGLEYVRKNHDNRVLAERLRATFESL